MVTTVEKKLTINAVMSEEEAKGIARACHLMLEANQNLNIFTGQDAALTGLLINLKQHMIDATK